MDPDEAEFTKMTTKWSEAAVSEAIESAAKGMGYDKVREGISGQ